MSRFKTIRKPALTEAEKHQILSRLIAMKDLLNGYLPNLEIGSEDYNLLDHLGRHVMSTGEQIAKSPFWGKEAHRIGGK